ncbi:MAG: serine hydrolase, partial [Pseudonocardia sediminis]
HHDVQYRLGSISKTVTAVTVLRLRDEGLIDLDDADPVYRGLAIPLRFWKIGAFVTGGVLGTTGYLLDQTAQVGDVTERAEGDPPPLGPYRTFQVPVARIGELTGLELGPLVAADALAAPTPAGTGDRRLTSYADIVLRPAPE